MASNLQIIHDSLNDIRNYISKIGPTRRKGEAFEKKIKEATDIFQSYKTDLSIINKQIENKEFTDNEVVALNNLSSKIETIYNKILEFIPDIKDNINMASEFDLKVAMSLIPVMNDKEETTVQIIDSILFYDSMIQGDSKAHLINFVLKARLSSSAKLRLNSRYTTVEALISDMRKHLLTQKSDTALQSKLMRSKQGNKSIQDYGKQLEELFVDLTISQANGDCSKYDILKPINEKNAIKQFADGLRNPKLSTIITARNYNSLKDAIRAAQDEEIYKNESEQQIFTMSRRGKNNKYYNNNYNNNNNYFRNKRNFSSYNPKYNQDYNTNYNARDSKGHKSFRTQHFNRGSNRNPTPRSKTRNTNRYVNYASVNTNEKIEASSSHNSDDTLNYFFRESNN